MKLDDETLSHLAGAKFSRSFSLPIAAPEARVEERIAALERLAAGRSVVHVGFADHPELIASKIAAGRWLHGRLARVAGRLVGVDVNERAVAACRERAGEVYCHDLTSNDRLGALLERRWDWLLLPEVIEHVDHPVGFLERIRILYGGQFDRAAVTVPNAFELTNWRYLLRGREIVNSDHRYWFTPYTAAKVCHRAGWRVLDFSFCHGGPPAGPLERALLCALPSLRESILLVLSPT